MNERVKEEILKLDPKAVFNPDGSFTSTADASAVESIMDLFAESTGGCGSSCGNCECESKFEIPGDGEITNK